MITLECTGVSKGYKMNECVLRDVSLTITPGLYALIGPNGAGKTTLLRMVGGITQPTSGSVLLNAQDISRDDSKYKQRLGYLPQEYGFYPDMSGKEFLYYMSRLKGIPAHLYPDRVAEIVECVGLGSVLERKIGDWSMGLKRRLGIAQALLNDPDILLLDEPMVGLDPEEKLFFWDYFYKLSRNRIIILSTNALVDFITFVDGVWVLVKGELRFNGRVQHLLDTVEDKVWSVTLPADWGKQLAQHWVLSANHYDDDHCYARIISHTRPDIPGVQGTEPRVEDAYAYLVARSNGFLKE